MRVCLRVLLTVNIKGKALGEEGFALLCLCPLAWVDGVLRHQFEKEKQELVQGAISFQVLGVQSPQLETNKADGIMQCYNQPEQKRDNLYKY